MQNNVEELESTIGYSFNNKELLFLSLTHPSFANEHNIDKSHTNQRLEFLGDAVLELVSSDFLYRLYENYTEGILTKTRALIVCEDNLADVARYLRLYEYLLIGKGESSDNLKNNDSTMCDTLESLIGAIYLDAGLDEARKFIKQYILTDDNLNKSNNDYKSVLQEKANSNNVKIKYEVVKETGPDHNKEFEVAVYYGEEIYGKGLGRSKKEAEQNAAKMALDRIKR